MDFAEVADERMRRAKEHFNYLFNTVPAWLNDPQNAPLIGHQWSPITRIYTITARLPRPLPIEWGTILGECLHQLRAVLDNLVCQLVEHRGTAKCSQTTQFPIFRDRKRYELRSPGMLAGLSASDVDTISLLQPWNPQSGTYGRCLELLAWMNNRDKHRMLHPAMVGVTTYGQEDDARNMGEWLGDGTPADTGMSIPEMFRPRPPDLTFEPNTDAGTIRHVTYLDSPIGLEPTPVVMVVLDAKGPNPELQRFIPLTGIVFTERRITLVGQDTIRLDALPETHFDTVAFTLATVSQIVDRFRPEFL